MRTILLVLALAVLVAIGLIWMNVIDVDWNEHAQSPVEVGVNPVDVGTTTRNVQVPTIQVRDNDQPAPPAGAPAPAPAPANGQ